MLKAGGMATCLALSIVASGSQAASRGAETQVGALAPAAAYCDLTLTPADDLQAAVHSQPADGQHRTICLQSGTWQLDKMIEIGRSGIAIRGAGSEASILAMKPGVSSPVLVIGDARHQEPASGISDVRIESITIRGGGESEREFLAELPYLSNSAVIVRRGTDIVLNDLDVSHCRSACLLTEYNSGDVLISNNLVSGAHWDGISLNRAGPTRIINNTIRDNVAAGITVEYMVSSVVSGNIIADNGSHGVYLADAEHNVFANNQISDNHLAGVFLTCSVRERDPALCWDSSFSRDNVFEENRFERNRFGFQVAVDRAANCTEHEEAPNLSRADVFVESPNNEPDWERFGRCLAYDGSRIL